MARAEKTLAMRVLEAQDVPYEVIVYPDSIHDAQEVARHTGLPPEQVYKTLVVQADEPGFKPMLIMLAADTSLDLKKVAAAVGAKKVHMARHADAEKMTGLKVGGISALALINKGFAVYADEWISLHPWVSISAGQRGFNLKLSVDDLLRITEAKVIDASE